jgi:hypothetical protein
MTKKFKTISKNRANGDLELVEGTGGERLVLQSCTSSNRANHALAGTSGSEETENWAFFCPKHPAGTPTGQATGEISASTVVEKQNH